jgi:hypothetical protein
MARNPHASKPSRAAVPAVMRRRLFTISPILFFGNSAEFWMNFQNWYDLKLANKELPIAGCRRAAAVRPA